MISKTTTSKMLATAIACCLPAAALFAGDTPKDAKDHHKGHDGGAQDWSAFAAMATPGPHHEHLKPLAGTFDAKVKMWMVPNMPPMESTGVFKRKWILGGRYLQEDFSGDAMGQPFQGLGFMGYDNMQKKYTSTWMDSMSTGIMTSMGTCDGKGHVIIFTGKALNPMTGKMEEQKTVIRIESKDKHVYEMYSTAPDGKEFKSMEIVSTRKASQARASSK